MMKKTIGGVVAGGSAVYRMVDGRDPLKGHGGPTCRVGARQEI